MADGFRDNQFKVTPGIWSGNGGVSGELQNPPFNYTPGTVRVVSSQPNTSGMSPDAAERTLSGSSAIKLQRGYIRNLSTKLGNIGTKTAPQAYKLRFQFNPATIQQNVEARQDMYLSVLQDPYQLTQPVAASTAFSFELLFDRTHEVMNGGPVANLMDKPGQSTTSTSSGEAGDIGVLADLNVLYAIIGQGFTSETANEQYNVLKANAKREYDRAVASGDPLFTIPIQKTTQGNGAFGGSATTTTETIYQEKRTFDEYFAEFLTSTKYLDTNGNQNNINIGNSAFLVPMPMRIIFSSLYMIDGYVMSTNVMFTKFNTNMVPIQCRVLLNVNAVYIGFARDKTFLSESIEQSGRQARQELLDAQNAFNKFCQSYGNNMSNFIVTLGKRPDSVAPKYFDSGELNTSGGSRNPNAVTYTTTDSSYWKDDITFGGGSSPSAGKQAPYITSGVYNYADAAANTPKKKGEPGFKSGASSGFGKNKNTTAPGTFTEYLKDGNVIQVSHTTKVSVYGPYPTQAAANAAKPDPSKKVGEYIQTKSSSSADQWISNDGRKNVDTGGVSAFSSNTATGANGPGRFDTQEGFDQYASNYFLFVADVSMTVATPDGGVTQTKTASASSVFRGTDDVGGHQWKLTIPPCTAVGTSQNKNPYRDSGQGRR